MTASNDFHELLTAWLEGEAPASEPEGLAPAALSRTRATTQVPSTGRLERWLPMAVITSRGAIGTPAHATWRLLVTLLLLLLLAGGLIAGGLVVGSRLLSTTAPIPLGGAAVLAFDAGGDLFTIRADGTHRRQLTEGLDRDGAPVWSPDGTRIAFRRVGPNGVSVAVVDTAGGDVTTIHTSDATTDTDCVRHAPAWSPDGRWLVFSDDDCGGPATLLAAASDGSGAAFVFLDPGITGGAPAWSRTSEMTTSIAFVGNGSQGQGIYVADIFDERRISAEPRFHARLVSGADPDVRWIPNGAAPLSGPLWSPDGKLIAAAGGTDPGCTTATLGSMDAFVIEAAFGRQTAVAATDAKEYNPTWSPDGHLALQRIVEPAEYVHGRPCTMAVWITDQDGHDPARLTTLGTDDSQPPFWSPDGSRIVGNTVRVQDGVEHYDLYIETVDGSSAVVTVEDVGYATWQPVPGATATTRSATEG